MRKITVIARCYTRDEEFWLGYRCRKCGLRFESRVEINLHSLIHQTIIKRKCGICGEVKQLQKHHISYHPEIILELCAVCHGIWHRENTSNWGRKGCMEYMKSHTLIS